MDRSELELVDWRRLVAELYAAVRSETDPATAHETWRVRRDRLFSTHPQSPLAPEDPLRTSGLPYWPYDTGMRFELGLVPVDTNVELSLPTDNSTTTMRLIGRVQLPAPFDSSLDVWWLEQYGGGLFLPVRDATAGTSTYGGGRYYLDTAKGADLGGSGGRLIVDLNFLYHPSCRYSSEWVCPLAPEGNRLISAIEAGERL